MRWLEVGYEDLQPVTVSERSIVLLQLSTCQEAMNALMMMALFLIQPDVSCKDLMEVGIESRRSPDEARLYDV